MIWESNPWFMATVLGVGWTALEDEVIKFANYMRHYDGEVTMKPSYDTSLWASVSHKHTTTQQTKPEAFKHLTYYSRIEIDGEILSGGVENAPWPQSPETVQLLTLDSGNYQLCTKLRIFFNLKEDIPHRCQWIWNCTVEGSCSNVYQHYALPSGAYCASYRCSERGIYCHDKINGKVTSPGLITIKESFLSGVSEILEIDEQNRVRGQEYV